MYIIKGFKKNSGTLKNGKPWDNYTLFCLKEENGVIPVIVIHILAVHPDYLGCGVGKAVLEYAENFGRRQGARTIRLDTYEKNTPAVRLYEKCNFQECGRVDLGLEPIYGLKWYRAFEKIIN